MYFIGGFPLAYLCFIQLFQVFSEDSFARNVKGSIKTVYPVVSSKTNKFEIFT